MWRPLSANCIRQLCSPASSPWNFERSGGGPEKDPTGGRKAIKECRARPGRQRWLLIPPSHRNANFALVKVGFGWIAHLRRSHGERRGSAESGPSRTGLRTREFDPKRSLVALDRDPREMAHAKLWRVFPFTTIGSTYINRVSVHLSSRCGAGPILCQDYASCLQSTQSGPPKSLRQGAPFRQVG